MESKEKNDSVDKRHNFQAGPAYTEKVVVVEGTIGQGTDDNPFRKAKRYFTEDGIFIGIITQHEKAWKTSG